MSTRHLDCVPGSAGGGCGCGRAGEEDAESTQAQQEADNPEDFWSPVSAPTATPGKVDDYGALQPVPDHDGTECLKWDDSLWSHADHFKVC